MKAWSKWREITGVNCDKKVPTKMKNGAMGNGRGLLEHRRPEDLGGSQGATDSDGHEKAKVGMVHALLK